MATLNPGFDADAWTTYAQDLYTQMQFFEEIDSPPPDENSWHDRANELMSQMKFFEEIDSWIHTEKELFKELASPGSSENLAHNKKHLKHKLFFVINTFWLDQWKLHGGIRNNHQGFKNQYDIFNALFMSYI